MKKSKTLLIVSFTFFFLFSLNLSVFSQVQDSLPSSFPAEVNKIFTTSCMPCHTSKGGFMSREKLNFTEWGQYSPDKQKEKAEKIVSELKEGGMPPQMVRDTRPEIVPTHEQIDIIAKWSEQFMKEKK